jgi:hypothetical protein
MAPPTVGHEYGLAAVAQAAISCGLEGGFELLTVIVVQGDVDHSGLLPHCGLGE